VLAHGLVERDADEDAALGPRQLRDGADVADGAAAVVGGGREEAGAAAGVDLCFCGFLVRFFGSSREVNTNSGTDERGV
jgi:hypothetical protein